MKRRHLFEFTDLTWWPGMLRGYLTDYLEVMMTEARPFAHRADLVRDAVEATGARRIVDLCAGSAGPWAGLKEQLPDTEVVLTDKFPSEQGMRHAASVPGVSYHPGSVDATAVPPALAGMRTLFNGLHHFGPDAARGIVADAVRQRQGIAVFEVLQRNRRALLFTLRAPLALLRLTPRIRPRTFTRFLFTYLVPILPLMVLWDGLVSVLRCHTAGELLAMGRDLDADGYVWKAGEYEAGGLPVTYFVGYPKPPDASAAG